MNADRDYSPSKRRETLSAIVPASRMRHSILLFGDSRRFPEKFLADLEYMGFSIRSAVGLSIAQMQALPNIRFIAFHVNETVWEQLEIFTRTFGQSQDWKNKQKICLVLRSGDQELDHLVEMYLQGLSMSVKGIDGPDHAAESIWLALNIANDALIGDVSFSEGFYPRSLVENGGICALDYQSYALSSAIRHNDKVEWWQLFEETLSKYASLCMPLRLTVPTAPAFWGAELDFLRLERLLSHLRSRLHGGLTLQFSAGVSTFDVFSKINFETLRRLGVEAEYAVAQGQLPCFKCLGLSGVDRVILDTSIFRGNAWNKIVEGLFCMFFASLAEVGMKTAVSGPIENKILRKLGQIGCAEYLEADESAIISLEGLRHMADLNRKMGGKLI